MKLKVLGSGSSGNCYILENNTEALIIEAGLPFKEVKRALDFNVMKIVGVAISHSHGDHSKYGSKYETEGIPVFRPYEAKMESQVCKYGNFEIRAFDLVHDVPCYGFYIVHPTIGSLIYISDTEYVKWTFEKVNHILVEANYCKELIDCGSAKYKHQITGHMEIETSCEFIKKNKSSALRNVILLHLSNDSADAEDFKARAEKVADCPVCVAKKGLEIDLRHVLF